MRSISIIADTRNGSLLIGIADNGCGIPPENVPHIFDQFFTTKQSCQGLGIGLFIVKRIIIDLGGTISVESKLDKGTRFEVILPILSTKPLTSEMK